jgi:hypothetical protein
VLASFASLGDVIVSEPGALLASPVTGSCSGRLRSFPTTLDSPNQHPFRPPRRDRPAGISVLPRTSPPPLLEMASEAELHVRGRLGRLSPRSSRHASSELGAPAQLRRSRASDEESGNTSSSPATRPPVLLDYVGRIFGTSSSCTATGRAEDPAMITGLARFAIGPWPMGHQKVRRARAHAGASG